MDIGLIGTGAIGSNVAKRISTEAIPNARVTSVYNRTPERAHELVNSLDTDHDIVVESDPISVSTHTDIIIEAASQSVIQKYAVDILETGTDLIVMSVGAFRDKQLLRKVQSTAETGDAHIHIPSGAIAALDGIRAMGNASIDEVSLTCYRSPQYLKPYLTDDRSHEELTDGETIFEGTATEAAESFPSHMNVAIALTLAADVEPESVSVQINVQNNAPRSRYVIQARSPAGTIDAEIQNFKTPTTPETSLLIVHSVIAMLKRLSSHMTLGS